MSIQAVAAVLTINYGDPTRKLIAIGLANHADEDGAVAYPAVKKLAAYASCSERTVQRHLAVMLEEGMIRKGDQSHTAGLDPRRRPIVYDVALSEAQRSEWKRNLGCQNVTPPPDGQSWGDTGDDPGVTDPASWGDTAVSPKPSINHPSDHPSSSLRSDSPRLALVQNAPGGPESGSQVPEGQQALIEAPGPAPARPGYRFEDFWKAYPRKEGKKAAQAAWTRATKATDTEVILTGLARSLAHWQEKRTETRFIPHPTTWLNQGRWDDQHEAQGMTSMGYPEGWY